MSRARDEDDTCAVGDHEVAGRDGDVGDDDRHVRAGLDDPSTRGVRRAAPREERKVVALRLVDVASRTVDDHAGNPAQLRGKRQVAAPTRSVDPASLLDHDHITRLPGLDRGRPQMTRRHRPAIVGLELHRHDAAGDAAIGRKRSNAGTQHP